MPTAPLALLARSQKNIPDEVLDKVLADFDQVLHEGLDQDLAAVPVVHEHVVLAAVAPFEKMTLRLCHHCPSWKKTRLKLLDEDMETVSSSLALL